MKYIFSLLFLIIFSCQPLESLEEVVFDNNQLDSISINAKKIEIINLYESKFAEYHIDHSLKFPPVIRLNSWIKDNIKNFGSKNVLKITILDASLKRLEEKDTEAKKFESKDIYKYETFFLVDYNLYDDSNYLIDSANVESYRSTTSGISITISERERIIDELILESIRDFSNQSKNLISQYMADYIL